MPFADLVRDNLLLLDNRILAVDVGKVAKRELKELCCELMEKGSVSQEHFKIGLTLVFFKAHVAVSVT
jgi:myosin heavy subunit